MTLYSSINSSVSVYGHPDGAGTGEIESLISAYNTETGKSYTSAHDGLVKIDVSDRRMVMSAGAPVGGESTPMTKSNDLSFSVMAMDGSELTALKLYDCSSNMTFKTDVMDAAGHTGIEYMPMNIKSYRFSLTDNDLAMRSESKVDSQDLQFSLQLSAKLDSYPSRVMHVAGDYKKAVEFAYCYGSGKSDPAKKYDCFVRGQSYLCNRDETLKGFNCVIAKTVTYNSTQFDLGKIFNSATMSIEKVWPMFAEEKVVQK